MNPNISIKHIKNSESVVQYLHAQGYPEEALKVPLPLKRKVKSLAKSNVRLL